MPMTNVDRQAYPAWAELERFDILRLASGESVTIGADSERLKIVVFDGSVIIDGESLARGKVYDRPASGGALTVADSGDGSVIVPLHGHWGNETGGSGVFSGANADEPRNPGTAVDYERATAFDNHYHDCDEYWIFVEGEAATVSEGTFFHMGPGDCLITGAGDHHDIADIIQPIRAVYFETTLVGAGRKGHLWEHRDGPAVPARR